MMAWRRSAHRSRHLCAPYCHSRRLLALPLIAALMLPAAAPCLIAQAPPVDQDLPSPGARFVVVLDAAHGGEDPGATLAGPSGGTEPEKDFTLALSVRLRSLLAARGMAVVTTRESDATLDSVQRDEIANRAHAQACLVLHASMSGFGVHLFLSSLAAAAPERFMPWKTAQAAWIPRSVALAGVLNSALLHAGETVTLGRTALTTVDSMNCPAIAIEVAPPKASDGASLDDPGYQAHVAAALAAGLLEWRADAASTGARQP